MSEVAVLAALRVMGFDKDTVTGHGFRPTARTLLDEVLGFRPDIIEHQLPQGSQRPGLHRTTHLVERTRMMQEWADYLDQLRHANCRGDGITPKVIAKLSESTMKLDYDAVELPPLKDAEPETWQLAWRLKAQRTPAWKIRREMPMPRHFYKFMNFAGSGDCVRNLRCMAVDSNFWLSSPENFNDPFDFQCRIELSSDRVELRRHVERLARGLRKTHGLTAAEAKRTVSNVMQNSHALVSNQSVLQRDRVNHGATCLTPDPRNLLMWAHYASSHRGICLQFRTDADPGIFASAVEVEYRDEYPIVRWPSSDKKAAVAYMLRKGTQWAYEKERRIVMLGLRSRTLSFVPRALRGIILGCKFPATHRASLQSLLDERGARGHPPVSIYQAEMHPSRFELTYRKERL